MDTPPLLPLKQFFSVTTFELVCDTPRGHTSQYAPSTPTCRHRRPRPRPRDGSSSPRDDRSGGGNNVMYAVPSSDTSSNISATHAIVVHNRNRWDASNSCSNSPIKPHKPKIDGIAVTKTRRVGKGLDTKCPSPCTLHNVLKPVRRQSLDYCDTNGSNTDADDDDVKKLTTVDLLANVLDHLAFFDYDHGEEEDNTIFFQQ